ncbi:sina homologue [Carabus blaptoides fortunei]
MGSSSSLLSDAPPEVLNDLRCTNCHELLTCPPIMWYPELGNICGRCPQEAYNDGVRNTAFEALAKLQSLPCRFKNVEGCSEILKWEQVKNHEYTCDFRNHACPTFDQSCQWNGRKGELQEHYKEKHVKLFTYLAQSTSHRRSRRNADERSAVAETEFTGAKKQRLNLASVTSE